MGRKRRKKGVITRRNDTKLRCLPTHWRHGRNARKFDICKRDLKYLVDEQGCNPCCLDKLSRSPLHYAAQSGDIPTIKYLIQDIKCDSTCTDRNGLTPKGVTRI